MKPKPTHLGPEYGAQFQDPAMAASYRKRPPYPRELIDLILERTPLPGQARVLELGAGAGDIAVPLSKHVKKVDAVEPSEAMRRLAIPGSDSERLRWHPQSAETYSYGAVYDLVICAQSLAWLDWKIVFPKLVGALDPEGWLIIVNQSALTGFPWERDLDRIIARYSTNQDYQPYDLIEELQSRGLFELRGRKSTWPEPFSQSVADYLDSIHARNGFSRDRMTPAAASAFDAEVCNLILAHHPDGQIEGRNQAHIQWGKPRLPRD